IIWLDKTSHLLCSSYTRAAVLFSLQSTPRDTSYGSSEKRTLPFWGPPQKRILCYGKQSRTVRHLAIESYLRHPASSSNAHRFYSICHRSFQNHFSHSHSIQPV